MVIIRKDYNTYTTDQGITYLMEKNEIKEIYELYSKNSFRNKGVPHLTTGVKHHYSQ